MKILDGNLLEAVAETYQSLYRYLSEISGDTRNIRNAGKIYGSRIKKGEKRYKTVFPDFNQTTLVEN